MASPYREIKTVIFDLGRVIIPFDFQRFYAAVAPFCSCPAGEIPGRIRATGLVRPFEMGQVEPDEFVRRLCASLELNVAYDEFCRLWSTIFLPDTLIPDSMIEGLRARRRVLLLSNTNAIHFAMIRETYPVIRLFDDCVLSYEVGAMKPEPEIYREAIARARCEPEAIFFTDDIAANVEAARDAGIDAVQFQSLPQLEEELGRRGVQWDPA